MNDTTEKIQKSNCRKCARTTRQEVLFEITHGAEVPYYNELHTWQVLRCMGCEVVGFRHRFDDYDDVEELPSGKSKHATTFERYPKAIAGHRLLGYLHAVPDLISEVYRQSVTAYAGGALILAGIGLRPTIEAVCNHLEISGNSLEKRIDALFKNGHISSSDKRRLHAIRFLGNDAAHEIKQPKSRELNVALEIVEHLINSVFILEYRSKHLDVTVETFEQFVDLLRDCIGRTESDQPQSLISILGRNKRQLGSDIAPFEARLIKAIKDGEIDYMTAETEQVIDDKAVQLYSIDKDKADPIPF